MSDVTARATDTLIPQVVKVVIGHGEDAETYTLATFALAKTIRTFALMSELAQAAGISQVVGAAENSAANGEFSQAVAPSFVSKVLAVLPGALANGTPALYKLLGLLITPNAKLRRMDEDGEDIDGTLLTLGRGLAYSASNDQIVALLLAAVQVIGIESIIKQLPNLMTALTGGVKS